MSLKLDVLARLVLPLMFLFLAVSALIAPRWTSWQLARLSQSMLDGLGVKVRAHLAAEAMTRRASA